MSESASHILSIPIASALLEALASITFELLLFGALAVLAQLVCAHYNLHRLYDQRAPIKIGSPILPLRVHAPIGHLPLSITLASFLFIASLMNNLLSFSINGRSEPRFSPAVYTSLVTADPTARPLSIDYTTEFRARPKENGEAKAPLISARLRAIRMADQCQFCNYTKCTIYAYAFDGMSLNTSLVDPDEYFPSTCVTTEFFERDDVWHSYQRFTEELSPTLGRISTELPVATVRQEDKCKIESVDADFADDQAFASATLTTSECNFAVQDVRCFRREGEPMRCAAVAKVPEGGLKLALFLKPSENSAVAEFVWVTNGHHMAESDFALYTSNVAYMASIGLSEQMHLLERLATATIQTNVTLQRRDSDHGDKLLSDVDLRIAVPGVAFNVILLVVLVTFDVWLYYSAVWTKKRQGFNSFSSVPDVLAVLSEEAHDRRRVDADGERPGIAIQIEQPSLGVSRSKREDALERHITARGINADDWDELHIS